MSKIQSQLKQNKLLAPLDNVILDEFVQEAKERYYSEGDVLTAELVQGDEIFLILKGEILISAELVKSSFPVDHIEAGTGELVGLVNFIDESLSHVTETAATDLKVLVWKASAWRKICDKHPKAGYTIAVGVSKVLVHRILQFNMHMLDTMSWGID
jgi:CRP-like cAMP-binding protein